MAGSSVAEARTRDCIGGQAASSCSSPFRPAVKHIGHPNYVQFAVPIGHGGAVECAAAIDARGGSARSSNSLANQIDIPAHVADGCLFSPVPLCELASLPLRDTASHRPSRENLAKTSRVSPPELGNLARPAPALTPDTHKHN